MEVETEYTSEDVKKFLTKYINKVYKSLGCGLSEFAYQRALEIELIRNNHGVIREYYLPQYYKNIIVSNLRVDLCVFDLNCLVELKTISKLTIKERLQAKKYKELSHLPVCLVNFGYKGLEIEFY